MSENKSINLFGGTYNESIQVQGNFIQGNQYIQADNVAFQNQENPFRRNASSQQISNADIVDIQNRLAYFQAQLNSDDAIHRVASELADAHSSTSEGKSRLLNLVKYVAANGGIEAAIGKVIELALKLVVGI